MVEQKQVEPREIAPPMTYKRRKLMEDFDLQSLLKDGTVTKLCNELQYSKLTQITVPKDFNSEIPYLSKPKDKSKNTSKITDPNQIGLDSPQMDLENLNNFERASTSGKSKDQKQ